MGIFQAGDERIAVVERCGQVALGHTGALAQLLQQCAKGKRRSHKVYAFPAVSVKAVSAIVARARSRNNRLCGIFVEKKRLYMPAPAYRVVSIRGVEHTLAASPFLSEEHDDELRVPK